MAKEREEQINSNSVGDRDAIVRALNKTVEIFTSHSGKSFDEVISSGLQPVADAAGLNRIAVYRLLDKESIRMGQIYVWAYGKTVPLDKELVELPKVPPVLRWLDELTKGNAVHGNAADMPQDQADFCKLFGVKSILFEPIFTHDEFWGVVTLEDHINFRYFDEDCLDLLHSTARLCANAFIRNEMAMSAEKAIGALERREKKTNLLNQMAVKFLSQSEETFDQMMDAGVRLIADIADLDRLSVWRNTKKPDGLYTSQIYRWDRETGGTTPPTPSLADAAYAQLAPRWESYLASDNIINGPVSALPESDMLKAFGIISTVVTPVFRNNEFWGFVLFEDRINERYFDYDTVDMMKSAAFLCVNTIMRAEMERDIADADEYNRATLNVLPVGFLVIDDHLQFIDCNDTLLKMVEAPSKQEFLANFKKYSPKYQKDGRKSIEIIHEVHRRSLNGEILVFEWEHLSTRGEIIPCEITLTRSAYRGGYILFAYQYDLRNIKRMEKEVIAANELLKTRLEQQELISEISRGFISSGDSETYIKEALAKMGHYHKVSSVFIFSIDYENSRTDMAYNWTDDGSEPTLIEFDFYSIIRSSFPERLPDCATLPIVHSEDIAASSNQENKPLLSIGVNALIVAPLYVEGRLWGVLSVEQRQMPRKWTENEKSFVAMTASTIAGVIMRNIYNTMLKDALEKATIASKAKGEFLSNMSHEMRTPLNAIIGMTAIAKNAVDMERKNYALNKIEDASAHLLGVINDVLDMSKIEANKLELSSIEFHFEKVLQKAITVITFRVEEKHQKLSVHIDKAIPDYLIGDDQRLTQVVTNLLGNAVKFTPDEGSIILEALLLEEDEDLYTIQVSVTDTGIGISEEQQARLFQSFQQAEASTVRKFGGTGLGLAISKNIVEMMSGKIWVESELHKGSKFAFTIKAKRGEGKILSLREKAAGWEHIRILAVDDDPDILEFFKDISQRYQLRCDTAISSDDAMRLVERNGDYNIYFIDWKMPGIDGITLTGALKSIERKPGNSVVIMISAVEWTEVEKEARKAGVDRFLSKPLFPSAVADTISECLGVDRQKNKVDNADKFTAFDGHRILLVEDVEINREIVLTILEPMGLEIDSAENGIKAVEMYCEEPERYDMIFMDVQMPEMDGYDATRKIREFETETRKTGKLNRRIPIIAMTANVFKEDVQKCLDAGMDDHVGKPLDFEVVVEKLRSCLK
jgi:signal transduction histidine kinase/DNA-binding response OmpR family regulator/PAS domain-containing protein